MGSIVPVQRYHPNQCTITEAQLTAFLDATLDGTLTQVPGIDQAAVAVLNAAGVMNVFHLLGDYLTLCEVVTDAVTGEQRVDVQALKQKFWLFLGSIGINVSNRSNIVLSISSKVGTCIPGCVDPTNPNGNLTE